MSRLPYYCRCNPKETQTLPLFGQSHVLLTSDCAKSMPDHSATQQGWPQPIQSRCLVTNGPTFASLGVWDGN